MLRLGPDPDFGHSRVLTAITVAVFVQLCRQLFADVELSERFSGFFRYTSGCQQRGRDGSRVRQRSLCVLESVMSGRLGSGILLGLFQWRLVVVLQ